MPGYTFDVENRINGYGSGPVITYNPDGLRGVNATSGSPVFYFYDGDRLLYEVGYTGDTIAYGWGAAGLSQKYVVGASAVVAYAYDPQGSVVSSYDDYANWSDLFFYDAFGQLREAYSRAGTSQGPDIPYSSAYGGASDTFGPVGFGGQWGYYTDYPSFSATYGQGAFSNVGPYAATSGQLLLGHRYYDPLLARFLSRDPIGYEGGINLYAYCGNNPIMGRDPSGLEEETVTPEIRECLRRGAVKEAIDYLNGLGVKSKIYDSCLKAILKSGTIRASIASQLTRLRDIANELIERLPSGTTNLATALTNKSGSLRCDAVAQKIADVLNQSGIENIKVQIFRMTPLEDGAVIKLVGSNEVYDYHEFVRVGNFIMDSVNNYTPEEVSVWEERFVTGTEFFMKIPWSKFFDKVPVR